MNYLLDAQLELLVSKLTVLWVVQRAPKLFASVLLLCVVAGAVVVIERNDKVSVAGEIAAETTVGSSTASKSVTENEGD